MANRANSLIQTISELYEHDGEKGRPALGALLARMTVADKGPVRRSSLAEAQRPFALQSTDPALPWRCSHARDGDIDAVAASRDSCRREDRFGLPRPAGDRCLDRGKDIEVVVYAGG